MVDTDYDDTNILKFLNKFPDIIDYINQNN